MAFISAALEKHVDEAPLSSQTMAVHPVSCFGIGFSARTSLRRVKRSRCAPGTLAQQRRRRAGLSIFCIAWTAHGRQKVASDALACLAPHSNPSGRPGSQFCTPKQGSFIETCSTPAERTMDRVREEQREHESMSGVGNCFVFRWILSGFRPLVEEAWQICNPLDI